MSGRAFEAAPNREAVIRRFGVMPHWSINDKISRHTYNARSETVMEKPAFGMYHHEVSRGLASLREQSYLVNAHPPIIGKSQRADFLAG